MSVRANQACLAQIKLTLGDFWWLGGLREGVNVQRTEYRCRGGQHVSSVCGYQKARCTLGKLRMVMKSAGMLWNVSVSQKKHVLEGVD